MFRGSVDPEKGTANPRQVSCLSSANPVHASVTHALPVVDSWEGTQNREPLKGQSSSEKLALGLHYLGKTLPLDSQSKTRIYKFKNIKTINNK